MFVNQCDEEVWDKIFDVNVKSAFLLTKEVAPHLISRGGGSIVYVSSIAGVNPMPVKIFKLLYLLQFN